MRSVTSKRILPGWAREELAGIAERGGFRIHIRPEPNEDQAIIEVFDNLVAWTWFRVIVKSDWSNLAHMTWGDLENEIQDRWGKYCENYSARLR